jgi:uncharacterized membrane protein
MADEKTLVLGIFPSEEAADKAVDSLKDWDKASDELKLYAIGVLTKDPATGEIKTQKMGARMWGRGAGIGLVLGAIAAIPTGGLSLAAAGGGAAMGGVIGNFFHKGLGMSDEDATRIGSELEASHAAVGVLAEKDQADTVEQHVKELGGVTEKHEVSEEERQKVAQAAQ